MGTAPGLCGRCAYARVVTGRRGATFHLCKRSATDPAYPRYPVLPVLRCAGFERRTPETGRTRGGAGE